MNSKAQFEFTRKTFYWMIAGVMITFIVLGVIFFMADYQNSLSAGIAPLQAEAIAMRFTESADCFVFVDDLGTVHPGIIDLNKFNAETLSRCYRTEPEKGYQTFNFRLKLVFSGPEIITNNYFHHDDFTLNKEVLVWNGNNLIKDQLKIYVQEKI